MKKYTCDTPTSRRRFTGNMLGEKFGKVGKICRRSIMVFLRKTPQDGTENNDDDDLPTFTPFDSRYA